MKVLVSIVLVTFVSAIFTQNIVSYTTLEQRISKKTIVTPSEIKADFFVNLNHLEAPSPSGDSYKSFLLRQKVEAKKALIKTNEKTLKSSNLGESPSVLTGKEIELLRYSSNGNAYPLYGGIPNDNTVAVSNGGIMLASINTFVYAYDLTKDTAIFPNQRINLSAMANGSIGGHYFDPKTIYDPINDRFILVFLKDSEPETSELIVCFSSSNNPNDSWNVYNLPGNPLNNNRWTDFPAIAITKDKLYYTANLIVPDVSWQIGFDGSIIWEIPTQEGYQGATDLDVKMYKDIKHNNKYIRNLHPVQGIEGVADKMYFLSNRNFDIANDSIFVLDLEETLDSNYLNINVYQSNLNYGVPPNARQQDTDTSDVTSGLQTNDARVLGAIKFENEIQFVGNTMNPETGFCGIYHGTIAQLNSSPLITAEIIGDTVKDYGYPNIAWSGNEVCDKETIIAFNYSSFTDFPGMAAVYYSNDKKYSKVSTIKEGANYVSVLSGTYQRWGDYFGLQRIYNKPGRAMSFGYIGTLNKKNIGYAVELISPDTMALAIDYMIEKAEGICDNTIRLEIINGVLPFTVNWSDESTDYLTKNNVCVGDSLLVTVIDARGCSNTLLISIPFADNNSELLIYPNPSPNWVALQFELAKESQVEAFLYDDKGALITNLLSRKGKQGKNELVFTIENLAVGKYSISLLIDGKLQETSSIIKN